MQSQSQVTGFCFKLLDRINEKFNNKIAAMEQHIIAEHQQKLAELQHLTTQFDNYHKIKASIAELNAFYKYTNKGTKNIMAVPCPPIAAAAAAAAANPYVTRPNMLLSHDITVVSGVVNGDCLQMQNNQPPKIVPPALLVNGTSDTMFKTHSRVLVKKHNNVNGNGGDLETFVIETSTTDIVIEFKNHEVLPEQCTLRYATFPYENKQSFSYINTILGSPDGQNWSTLVDNIEITHQNNKANVYKVPIVTPSSSPNAPFYKYLCFRSNSTRDIVAKNNLQKMFNKANIPISCIEVYGLYTTPSNQTIIKGLDVQFQNFVKSFVAHKSTKHNTTAGGGTTANTNETITPEIDYVLNMFLESYKELNSLLTTFKINQALKNNETINETINDIEQLFTIEEEPEEVNVEESKTNNNIENNNNNNNIENNIEPTEPAIAIAAAAAAAAIAANEPDIITTSNKKIKVLDLQNNATTPTPNVVKRKNNKKSPLGANVITVLN